MLANAVEVAVLLEVGDSLASERSSLATFGQQSDATVDQLLVQRGPKRERTGGVVTLVVAVGLGLGPFCEAFSGSNHLSRLPGLEMNFESGSEQFGNLVRL